MVFKERGGGDQRGEVAVRKLLVDQPLPPRGRARRLREVGGERCCGGGGFGFDLAGPRRALEGERAAGSRVEVPGVREAVSKMECW